MQIVSNEPAIRTEAIQLQKEIFPLLDSKYTRPTAKE